MKPRLIRIRQKREREERKDEFIQDAGERYVSGQSDYAGAESYATVGHLGQLPLKL
jgi:hypothetical protein